MCTKETHNDVIMRSMDEENVPNVSASLYVDQYRGSVLLQTATAEVMRPDNDNSLRNVRLVFNPCSQRAYVTQAVKEKLQLPYVGRDSLLIKTFGESDARLHTCEIVQVGIKTLCDTTVYIQQQSIQLTQFSYEHLRDLPLADQAGGGVLPVSILIGVRVRSYFCYASQVWAPRSIIHDLMYYYVSYGKHSKTGHQVYL